MSVKKDKKPLLVKFSLAQTTGDNNVSIYSDWNVIYISDKSINSAFYHEPYGSEKDFDLTLLLDANPITRQINDKSIFLIDEYPTLNNNKGNYRIKKIFPEYLGVIKIGLESIKGNNLQSVYYLNGENIYEYQLNFDRNTNKGYINKNISHPFLTATKIWSLEPTNNEDTENLISFVSEKNVGIIDRYKIFKELTFEEI